MDDIRDVCMVWLSVVLSSCNGCAAKARYVFKWYRMKCHGIEQKGIAMIEWWYVSRNHYWMDDIRDVWMVWLSLVRSSCNGCTAKARYVFQWYRMKCCGIEQKGIATIKWQFVSGNHYWMDEIRDVCMVWLSVVLSSCNGWAAKARYVFQWYRIKYHWIEQKGIAMNEWWYVCGNHYWMDDIRDVCMVWFSVVICSCNVVLQTQGMFSHDTEWSVVVLSRRVLLRMNDDMLAGTNTGWMTSGIFVWFG
jgi:hypothetical protein